MHDGSKRRRAVNASQGEFECKLQAQLPQHHLTGLTIEPFAGTVTVRFSDAIVALLYGSGKD